MASQGARKRLPREVRREQILDAALQCFCGKGFNGATISHIAKASGISKGNLYWHFESKEDLFIEVLELWCDRALADIDDIFKDPSMTFAQTNMLFAKRMHQYATKEKSFILAWLEFVTFSGRDPRVRERLAGVHNKRLGAIEGHITKLVRREKLDHVDPRIMARLLFALHDGLFLNTITWPEYFGQEENLAEVMGLISTLALAGSGGAGGVPVPLRASEAKE